MSKGDLSHCVSCGVRLTNNHHCSPNHVNLREGGMNKESTAPTRLTEEQRWKLADAMLSDDEPDTSRQTHSDGPGYKNLTPDDPPAPTGPTDRESFTTVIVPKIRPKAIKRKDSACPTAK